MRQHRKIPGKKLSAAIAICGWGNKGQLQGVYAAVFLLSLGSTLSSADPLPPTTDRKKLTSGIILRNIAGKTTLEIKGKADEKASRPITADTPFLIGSASKTFAAVAILTLVDKNLLALTDPVKKFFPDSTAKWLNDPKGTPTIHHLLNHTSGIPEAYNEPVVEENLFHHKLKFKQLFAAINHQPLRFAPGSSFEYANTGYIVLGEILRRVSASSYSSYLSKAMFTPLLMQQSSVGSPPHSLAALSYALIHGKHREYQEYFGITEKHVDDTFTDGNIYTSANDIFLWITALFSGKILSPDSLKAMLTNHGSGYGYGINIDKDERSGALVYDHDGEWIGYHALIQYTPAKSETFIKLENLIP
jgi:CubicO group peptidase (beta-lactamase class C family)